MQIKGIQYTLMVEGASYVVRSNYCANTAKFCMKNVRTYEKAIALIQLVAYLLYIASYVCISSCMQSLSIL